MVIKAQEASDVGSDSAETLQLIKRKIIKKKMFGEDSSDSNEECGEYLESEDDDTIPQLSGKDIDTNTPDEPSSISNYSNGGKTNT